MEELLNETVSQAELQVKKKKPNISLIMWMLFWKRWTFHN